MFLIGENKSDATQSYLEAHGDSRLPPEVEKGNVEYKLKLVNPPAERIEHLITQLKWRLAEGQGECLYEIGVSDKGTLVGLDYADMLASMKTLRKMASVLQVELSVVRQKTVGKGKMIAEILFRKCLADDQHLLEIRIAILGAGDAGKSSMLGVLCYEELDNGRGLARLNLLRHRHEIESGRSSAIAREIIGFTSNGKVINYASSNVSTWEHIASQAAKVVTFMDTCGHPKYQKTTIGALTGDSPDFACIIISANQGGLPDVSKEQIMLTILLKVPLMICITKIDIASTDLLTSTLEALLSFLKSPAISKLPFVIQNEDDLNTSIPLFVKGQMIPLFLVSSVTGENFSMLKKLFNLLFPNPSSLGEVVESDAELHIQDIYNVEGRCVVGGIMTKGQFHPSTTKNTHVICWLGPDQGRFVPCLLSSIFRHRNPVRNLKAGQAGTVAIKFLSEEHMEKWVQEKILPLAIDSKLAWVDIHPDFKIRRGQVLSVYSDDHPPPQTCNELRVDILVLYHPNGLQIGQDFTLHCGSVVCKAKVVDIGDFVNSKKLESTTLEPLNFDSVLNDLITSATSGSSQRRKKRKRLHSGITLKQGESGIVTFKLMSESEVISIGASVVARGAETCKLVGKVLAFG